jgi:hypothetical protein
MVVETLPQPLPELGRGAYSSIKSVCCFYPLESFPARQHGIPAQLEPLAPGIEWVPHPALMHEGGTGLGEGHIIGHFLYVFDNESYCHYFNINDTINFNLENTPCW